MDLKKSHKISQIIKLQQILKRWKNMAITEKNSSSSSSRRSNKSIKFLKRTLSFSDSAASTSGDAVRKGFLAVCVGREMKRFVIPTEYLSHRAFGVLLREAEEEFGFHQEGVLRIPCEVAVFERILKLVEEKREAFFVHELGFGGDDSGGCRSSEAEICASRRPPKPLCR